MRIERLLKEFRTTMEMIINEAGKPEFAASITQLKEKTVKTVKLNKDVLQMKGYFQRYPGLSRQFLSAVRGKIAEYTDLGVIDKYTTELDNKHLKN